MNNNNKFERNNCFTHSVGVQYYFIQWFVIQLLSFIWINTDNVDDIIKQQ